MSFEVPVRSDPEKGLGGFAMARMVRLAGSFIEELLGRLSPRLPPSSRIDGHELVYRGGFDELEAFLDWEKANATHVLDVDFARIREIRAWLDANATSLWTCTMSANGVGAAWDIPPGPQVVRLTHHRDATAILAEFPDLRRVSGRLESPRLDPEP